jgi:hypothetical protein
LFLYARHKAVAVKASRKYANKRVDFQQGKAVPAIHVHPLDDNSLSAAMKDLEEEQ